MPNCYSDPNVVGAAVIAGPILVQKLRSIGMLRSAKTLEEKLAAGEVEVTEFGQIVEKP